MLGAIIERARAQWRTLALTLTAFGTLAAVTAGASAAFETFAKALGAIGLSGGRATALIAVAGSAVAVFELARQREEWSSLLDGREPLRRCSPWDLGVQQPRRRHGEASLPEYVGRIEDEDVRRALREERWIVLAGDRFSGASRTAFEGVKHRFRGWTPVLRPHDVTPGSKGDLDHLLAATLPLRLSLRRTILWIDDLGSRISAESFEGNELRRFQRRHPRMTIVAQLRWAHYSEIKAKADQGDGWSRGILGRRGALVIPDLLRGEELAAAAESHPDVPKDRLERLPEWFVARRELLEAYLGSRHRFGGAIVECAVDWARCGIERPIPRSLTRSTAQAYLRGSAAMSDADFAAGLAWATERRAGEAAMLEPADAEAATGWRASPILVDYIDNEAREVVKALMWSRARSAARHRYEDILRIGDAAWRYGDYSRAREMWAAIPEDAPCGPQAGERLLREFDNRTAPHDEVLELLEVVNGIGVTDELTALSPRGVAATTPRPGTIFDPSLPVASGSRAAFFYRFPPLRVVLRTAVLIGIDVIAVSAGLSLAIFAKGLYRGDVAGAFAERWPIWGFSVGYAIPLLALGRAYKADAARARIDRISFALTAGALLAGLTGLAHGEGVLYSTTAWASFLVAIPFCWALRYAYDRISRAWLVAKGLQRRVLLIGPRASCLDTASRIGPAGGPPTTFVGYLSDDDADSSGERLGRVARLREVIGSHVVHHVVIADSRFGARPALRALDTCVRKRVTADAVLSLHAFQLHGRAVRPGSTLAFRRLRPLSISPGWRFVKRSADLGIALCLLAVLCPVLLAISFAVRRDTGDGVFQISIRRGFGTQVFGLRRFRTRVLVAGNWRVTRSGRWIERWRLDGLPQLFNVLDGEMSFVGPQALTRNQYERLADWQRRRYLVKPGITGAWRIARLLDRDRLDDLARADILYMRSWSIWRDLEILLVTPLAVLRRQRRRRSAPAQGAGGAA